MPHVTHYDNFGTARFFTFSCYHRDRLLITDIDIEIFLSELEASKKKYGVLILGYVIMPNHVHLVLYKDDNLKFGSIIGEIKRKSAYKIITRWKSQDRTMLNQIMVPIGRKQKYAFWLPRCYDHNCRTPDSVREKINYCHNNPVKAGLVSEPGDWKWSSFRWYRGEKNSIIQINEVEL